MATSHKTFLLKASAVSLLLTYGSCKKDDDPSRTELLTGEWELIELDGMAPDPGTSATFEFEDDGDFEICSIDGSSSYCYDGDWNWANSDEDEVAISYLDDFDDRYDWELEIETLTETELTGDLRGDGYSYDVVFEKN